MEQSKMFKIKELVIIFFGMFSFVNPNTLSIKESKNPKSSTKRQSLLKKTINKVKKEKFLTGAGVTIAILAFLLHSRKNTQQPAKTALPKIKVASSTIKGINFFNNVLSASSTSDHAAIRVNQCKENVSAFYLEMEKYFTKIMAEIADKIYQEKLHHFLFLRILNEAEINYEGLIEAQKRAEETVEFGITYINCEDQQEANEKAVQLLGRLAHTQSKLKQSVEGLTKTVTSFEHNELLMTAVKEANSIYQDTIEKINIAILDTKVLIDFVNMRLNPALTDPSKAQIAQYLWYLIKRCWDSTKNIEKIIDPENLEFIQKNRIICAEIGSEREKDFRELDTKIQQLSKVYIEAARQLMEAMSTPNTAS